MTRSRLLLFVVLFVALVVRLWGLGFGLPYIIARPDETEIAGPAVGFLSGDLRPPYFEWPTLFTYATAFLYVIYYALSRPFASYKSLAAFAESRRQSVAPFLYITRIMSAVMGVLTVWWVFAICRRMFDETVAVIAALFLALAFLHVRDSHFGVTDIAMTGLVVLAVLMILKWRDNATLRNAAVAGLVTGLAGSTKYNGIGVSVAFAVALAQRALDDKKIIAHGATFAIAMAAAFFGASPYIIIDWPRFVASVSGVATHLAEGHGVTLGKGWWYYARVLLPAALGWPMFVAGAIGMFVMIARRFRDAAVLFAFPITYYVFAGRGYTVFARYIIPVLPFICISAAWLVVTAVRGLTRSMTPAVRTAAITAASLVVVAPTAAKTFAADRLLATTDNRVVVARVLADMLPEDATLYQSGEKYGYVPINFEGREIAHIAQYDIPSGKFEEEPEWILLQRSPLTLYSPVQPPLEQIVRDRYVLVRKFETGAEPSRTLYDQQDAFYLPLSGFGSIARPGPSFELYRRR